MKCPGKPVRSATEAGSVRNVAGQRAGSATFAVPVMEAASARDVEERASFRARRYELLRASCRGQELVMSGEGHKAVPAGIRELAMNAERLGIHAAITVLT